MGAALNRELGAAPFICAQAEGQVCRCLSMGGNNKAMRRIELESGTVVTIEAMQSQDGVRFQLALVDGQELRANLTVEQALDVSQALRRMSEQVTQLGLMNQVAYR